MDENLQKDELNQIINYYSNQKNASSQDNVVGLLREIQELLGCIPLDIQEQASLALNINLSLIKQFIKLYPSLTAAPPRCKIILCLGPNCKTREAENFVELIRSFIRQKPFTLTIKNCLKQCRTAPNLQVNRDLYPCVTPKDIPIILEKYIE